MASMRIFKYNQMEINNFIMDYNQFHYYRRKIYFKDGKISHANPSSVSYVPEGGDEFTHQTRKHFLDQQFEPQNFMYPQTFANNNKASLEKSYERNLKTFDIEGANTNPVKSPAVRNKIKAQDKLIERQKEMNRYDEIKKIEEMEREQQKKMLGEQYRKNKYFSILISGKHPYEEKNNPYVRQEYQSIDYGRRSGRNRMEEGYDIGESRRKSSEDSSLYLAGKNILNQ